MTKVILRRLLWNILPAIFMIFSSQSMGAALLNFSWSSTSSLPGATVTYTFSYTIQTAAPNMILYAINNGTGDPFNCSAIGYPLNTSLVDVKINNVSQTIDASGSWGGTGNMAIRLVTAANATAGSNIVITIQNVVNTSTNGTYPWTWIRTADGGGNEIDGAVSPADIYIGGPTIAVSPASIAFGYTPSGSTSDVISYNLSGTALSPASGNIAVTPPANFEVSLSAGSGFSASAINVAYTSGSLASTPVYVRFKPTTANTPYSGNISNSGGTASLQNVAVTGSSLFSYCAATTNTMDYMGINHLVFNTINKTTTDINLGYNDFTAISTNVLKSETYTLYVYGWGYNQYFKAWFDWNNDGDFADAGEEFSIGSYGYSSSESITIPSGATTGNVRMRVRSDYQSSALPLACGAVDYGECEDYTVNVLDGAFVWNGSESTNWNTIGNWSTNVVPTSSDNVLIPDVTNDPVVNQAIGTPAACNNLTIEPGAVVTIAAGKALTVNGILTNNAGNTGLVLISGGSLIESTMNVAATVKSYIGASQWHLISSPVSDATSLVFLHKYLQTHTESTNAYTDITPTTGELTPMKGFAVWGDASGFTASYTGPLNSGVESYSTTYSDSDKGWNLVGNPYPSSIDWDASSGWTKTAVNNAIYLHVNTATFATYVGGTATNGGSRYIAPGQGFFVRASANGTLAMTNAVRIHNATTFFKNSEMIPDMVRLEVSGNNYKDEAVIRFLPGATAGFDGDYDAYKLYGDEPEAAQIYTQGSTPLAINSLPETNMIPVGVKAGVSGIYTIAATEINDLRYVTLEDTQTGIFTELVKSVYTFNFEAGENELRFKLHFSALGIDDKQPEVANIFSHQKTVFVNLKDQVVGDIFIYNVCGQMVAYLPAASGSNRINLENTGTYIAKVVSDKSMVIRKVFIQ